MRIGLKTSNRLYLFHLFPQALVVVLFLGWLFVPIYIKAGVFLHFFLFNQHCRTNFSNIADLHSMNVSTTSSLRYHFYDTLFSLSTGRDHARVPEKTLWWAADPYLPLRAFDYSIHFHQNLCESKICLNPYRKELVSHGNCVVLREVADIQYLGYSDIPSVV